MTQIGELEGPISRAGVEHGLVTLLHQDGAKDDLVRTLANIEAMPDDPSKAMLIDSVHKAIAIKDRLEQHLHRERGLLALIETAQDLTALRDIDQVLQAIVHRARKLLGCDIGYLSVYDDEQGDFYVRASDGSFSENFRKIRVPSAVGICGFVARNRSPYCSSDYETDSRFAHTKLIDSAVTEEDIRSILGVPLLAGSSVNGVLFVGNRYVRAYQTWEMSILSSLAAHAAVAIENARLFEQAQNALRQASAANRDLEKQRADTHIAAEAHERLTSLVARGGGLKEICEMVSAMLDGRVVVLDQGEQELFAVGAVIGDAVERSGDSYAISDKIHAALGESRVLGKSVPAFVTDHQVCRVSAVIGGRGLLGGLVIYTDKELNDVAVRIFERSSMVTGVVLLSEDKSGIAARRDLPVILRDLLNYTQDNAVRLAQRAANHGFDLSKSMYMLLLNVEQGDLGYILSRMRAAPYLADILFDEIDGALIFVASSATRTDLRQAVWRFLSENKSEVVTGVVSKPVAHASDMPATYQTLSRCLAVLPALGRSGSIFNESELSLYSMLFAGKSREEIDAFLASVLGKLHPGTDARKAELCKTLLVFLDAGHNARSVALDLKIHINTFRQRLESIHALLGEGALAQRSLDIHAALRIWALRQ
ncbi:helix-turn-helix domain-containing protein [Actimicrobium antarcticum]|uniref:Helix-turn-helix domain-containing protein n=1 Tax=Actimicrobium antarcticum TaxID=1051899 RepID=A0ABP7TEV1_9BURK